MDPRSIELIRLIPQDFRSWTIFPFALRRIQRFMEHYEVDGSIQVVIQKASISFCLADNLVAIWVATSTEAGLVGHMLAYLDENQIMKKRWATVIQYESDIALPKRIIAHGFRSLDEWAKGLGAQYIELATPLPERLWRRFGFRHHRSVMKKEF